MNRLKDFSRHIVVSNGQFPSNPDILEIIHNAETLICCDGAIESLEKVGVVPTVIIGDLDSINEAAKEKYASRLIQNPDQNSNDQTKAVRWAISQGIEELIIIGATGKREDHTLGNIALLHEYISHIKVISVTDYGVFVPITTTTTFNSIRGQQVSIFSLMPNTTFSSKGLKYPLQNLQLQSWWMGTLNEAESTTFTVEFEEGKCIVFLNF